MPAVSPILRRRRLGAELRALRESAGLTGDQVIERVGWASASKLSRLENGRSRPDPDDVADLLDLYRATPAQRAHLMHIAAQAGDIRVWLRSYPVMTARQRGYAELEAGCAEIREYSPTLVPGLLQTPEYARVRILSSAALGADHGEPGNGGELEDPETEVAARLSRQALLADEAAAPRYTAVLEEAALGRRAGPAEMMDEQLARLCELARLPHVTLRILPRDTRIADWYLPPTAFSLYRFADPRDPETMAIESDFKNFIITNKSGIDQYKMVFEWLSEAALSATDSLAWLSIAATRADETAAPAMTPIQRSRSTAALTDRRPTGHRDRS